MSLEICDVGPRDGLQTETVPVSPEVRAELSRRLIAAGLKRVEAASFVRDDLVPAMAGADQVLAAMDPASRARCAALVLNRRGLERALDAGIHKIHLVVAATESFARRNQGAAAETVIAAAEAMATEVAGRGTHKVRATITVAFGCPFEGKVDPAVVHSIGARLVEAGADELVLADTIGVAGPAEVASACARLYDLRRPFGLHPHDTRNTGAANAWAALETGATLLESSVGGLGGCPFAPGATGNLASEDLAYMLERSGVPTGIDLDALIDIVEWLEVGLERRLPSKLARAGQAPFAPLGAV